MNGEESNTDASSTGMVDTKSTRVRPNTATNDPEAPRLRRNSGAPERAAVDAKGDRPGQAVLLEEANGPRCAKFSTGIEHTSPKLVKPSTNAAKSK